MRSAARGTSRTREDHAQHVLVLVLLDQFAEREQLTGGLCRIPLLHIRGRRTSLYVERVESSVGVAKLCVEGADVVARGLDADQQAVERRELDTRCMQSGLECLHQRRARACERIEHVRAALEVPVEQHFDELWDELPMVGVQAVHVLRSHVLGERALGPRELEVQRRVELVLRDGHGSPFAADPCGPSNRSGTRRETGFRAAS